jgi:trehalose synthase-fused probable maltokinase
MSNLESTLRSLPETWWRSRRWFAAKSRRIRSISLFDQASLSDDPPVVLALVELAYAQGEPDLYALPLLTIPELADALDDLRYQSLLLTLVSENARRGPIRFEAFEPISFAEPRLLGVEQSNTSVAYGRQWILKNFRRVAFGVNRDLEVGRFLAESAAFPDTPRVAGAISYDGKGSATLGVLQRFVENQGDCWSYVLSHLVPPPNAPDDVYWAQDGLPDHEPPLLADIESLGRVTGELHRALSSRPDLPDFAPESAGEADRAAWLADAERQLDGAASYLGGHAEPYRRHLRGLAAALPLAGVRRIQIHGDYHLGQVLKTAAGFAIIDFEGEPARPLEERRAKQPALRDVAGMLRSLDYAACSAGLSPTQAEAWSQQAGARFVEGWQAGSAERVPPGAADQLLTFFQLAKAFYELNYELNNRPDWAHVPMHGIERLMAHA